jgi:hypothetical protein
VVADEAHMALLMEALAVEGDDTGRFLPSMLQGVETERRQRRSIVMSQNSENAAFFMQRISVERIVNREGMGLVHFCGPLLSQEWIGISRCMIAEKTLLSDNIMLNGNCFQNQLAGSETAEARQSGMPGRTFGLTSRSNGNCQAAGQANEHCVNSMAAVRHC